MGSAFSFNPLSWLPHQGASVDPCHPGSIADEREEIVEVEDIVKAEDIVEAEDIIKAGDIVEAEEKEQMSTWIGEWKRN